MLSRRLVSIAVLLAASLPASILAAEKPANILLISIDTLRADRLGCYGYQRIQTPHIDRLAAEGVRFERAFTPVPITLPAHAALLTGKYPMRTGMRDFASKPLDAKHPTLATLLRQRGYATASIIGAAVLDSRFGLNRGFDLYFDNFDFSHVDETSLEIAERRGDVVVDRALSWLGQQPSKPFFLWVHLL